MLFILMYAIMVLIYYLDIENLILYLTKKDVQERKDSNKMTNRM